MGKRKLSLTSDELPKTSRNHQAHRETSDGYDIKARIDPGTGQQCAFPGLEDAAGLGEDGEIFYGPAQDGIEYLRMVRAEASRVPRLLQSDMQPLNLTRDDNLDLDGFWAGEAMVALPRNSYDDVDLIESGDDTEHSIAEPREPQDVYYDALISRFTSLRAKLGDAMLQEDHISDPTKDAKSLIDLSSVASLNASPSAWYKAFSYSNPTPRSIASLTQSSVIIALERLEVLLTKRNMENPDKRRNFGTWSWALLARCREVGQLSGEEIGVLRSLAKTALNVEKKLRSASAGPRPDSQLDDVDEDDQMEETRTQDTPDVGESTDAAGHNEMAPDDEAELSQARERLLAKMDSCRWEENDQKANSGDGSNELQPALMALDSIVTIVGRLFGQRDLLLQRSAW